MLRKLLHHRQRREDVVGRIGVSDTRRTLAVELNKTVAGRSQKRIEARRRRDRFVTGIDRDQITFDIREPKIVDDTFVFNCCIFYFLNRRPDGLSDLRDAGEVGFSDEVRTQVRRKTAAAEDKFGAFQTLIERGTRAFSQVLVFEQVVVPRNSLWEHEALSVAHPYGFLTGFASAIVSFSFLRTISNVESVFGDSARLNVESGRPSID